jgi:alkanesulfonate monooxygenase SsuD/methylene tetrahydromethanopterin reductase-like flavin-dependent oxidoreductase (luciferase family)
MTETSGAPEFHLFLPQMRMPLATMVERARVAEAAGFTGLALMDHLAPPLAETQDMWDSMLTASWLLAATERLVLSHLVLCDAFRHPAVLAKEAVTLDHASGGRFELGIGWGSVPDEFERFGVFTTDNKERVARLRETLEVVRALWSGGSVDYEGTYHHLRGAVQNPPPLDRIPIVIGGVGPKTLRLVAEHADWWNLPVYGLHRLEELRPQVGSARVSIQQMLCLIPSEDRREEVTALTRKRFGHHRHGLLIGTADEVVAHVRHLHGLGVERIYCWMTDFGVPEGLERFGAEVISALR